MKTKFYKIIAFLLLIPSIGFSNIDTRQEKTKTINKRFNVHDNATLNISNKYGDINITTWNKNYIEFRIEITVQGDDVDAVKERLDAITVHFEANSNNVIAETVIEKTTKRWLFNSSNVNYRINYFVQAPINNHLNLNNNYGNINITETNGATEIDLDYGNISIDRLNNDSNSITLDYSRNSTIEYVKSGTFNTDYSTIKIEKSNDIDLNSDYTNVEIEKIKSLSFNSDYGTITVKNAEEINGNSDYVQIHLGKISKILELDTSYGNIQIEELVKGFELIDITGTYAHIKIEVKKNSNFNFNIDLKYAAFNYNKGITIINKQTQKGTYKYYEGYFGNNNKNSILKIDSEYGSVSIEEN